MTHTPLRIKPLSIHVANQIAAGEVIERPASVVKELLENALDAHASSIQVEIGFGGLNQITVSDDGVGMVADDLRLAITPHATSKLVELDDLMALNTMGFRGEALASIASIAQLSIESRPASCTHAMGIRVHCGETTQYPCARVPGTTVDIRDLFYNAPVRKQFLKTENVEYLAIEAVVKRFAFCEPSIAITLIHNGRLRLRLPRALDLSSQQQRLRQLFGKPFATHAIAIEAHRDTLHLTGWVSPILLARSMQDKQWIYLNSRMLRDKLLYQAIKLAYADLLPAGRYPMCLLHVTMPSECVDVNVHPTKHEVRFRDPRAVHDFIRGAIKSELGAEQTSLSLLKKNQQFEAPRASIMPDHWAVINSRFALCQLPTGAHLVNLFRLRQRVLSARLAALSLPWPSRPLLVPVNLALSTDELMQVISSCKDFESYGLLFAKGLENVLQVRAIPRDIPGLNLRALINAWLKMRPRLSTAWIDVFLAAEEWDLRQLADEDQLEWRQYWLLEQTDSILLDTTRCEEFMGV